MCNAETFAGLLLLAKIDIMEFKKWIKLIESKCKEMNINIIECSGGKEKNIDCAFYKSFLFII